MNRLKCLISLALIALLISLFSFWLAEYKITFVFSLAAIGYPTNLGYVVLNGIFLSLFLVFIKFRRKVVRLPASVYLAFIIALYIELYGFPLTMYAITWLFGLSNAGNLWELFVGSIGRDLFVVIFLGFILPI
jgi:hypothetical protein